MQPGSTVICINDSNFPPDILQCVTEIPRKDHVYTVRELIPDTDDPFGPPGIAVEGIKGKMVWVPTFTGRWIWVEYHFYHWRFAELAPPLTTTEVQEKELQMEEVN
jgi:hypothetical protein